MKIKYLKYGIIFLAFLFVSCSEYKTKELPDGTLEIVNYRGNKKDIVIPDIIKDKKVTVMG